MALKDRDLAFVDHYFELGFNATAAMKAINKKMTDGSARTLGWRALTTPAIREEIDRRMVDFRAKRRMSVEQFGDMLQEASTVDVLDLYNDDGTLKPLSEIPPSVRRQISSIEPEEFVFIEGKGKNKKVKREIRYKVKLWDLRKAQELWGKYKKMFTDKVDVTSDGKALAVNIVINGQKKGQG